jgi:NADH-quinone oxidoreductase subunit L
MQHYAWGVLLFPLAGFIILTFGQRLSNRTVAWIGTGSIALAFICAVFLYLWLAGQPTGPPKGFRGVVFSIPLNDETNWSWALGGPGQFNLNFGILLDQLSSTMTLVITGVGFLIVAYAIGYMADDPGYRRFFAQMDLFIFTMLLLVLADNYLWLLVGWAGVGLTSYLLIGYYHERPSAVAAARKALVMNVIGDWGIMIALFLMFIHFGAVDYQTVFSHVRDVPYGGQTITLIALFLLVGAVAKSAQLPLYTWLPDAMEGPTPVSALIHAATMVTAGVYLIARSYPIYQQSPFALHTVALIGGIGAVFAATMGLANTDIKRVLAYSTMSQIAYMFVGVGVAVYSSGIFHLVEHAFFKALLFMGAGAVIHALHDEQDIQKMGGLRKKLPFTHATFLIGVLAIIGTPLFSGFFSKEDVIGGAFARAQAGDAAIWVVWALVVVAAGLTALYMFRLYFLVFHGEPRDPELAEHAHEPGLAMKIPMAVLSLLSVVGGYLAFPGHYNQMETWLSPVFHRYSVAGPVIEAQPFSGVSMIVTLGITLLGFLAAWQIYYRLSPTPQSVGARAQSIYQLLYHKYYVDELLDLVIVRPIKFTGRSIYRFFEIPVVDGTVVGSGQLVRMGSVLLRRTQTGYARNYALGIVFGAVVMAGFYVMGGR